MQNQKIISEIGRSQRLAILNQLKRTQGLSVREIATRLKMSYMGIKSLCLELEKSGYLTTWRRPKPVGRPELLYRLTQRAHELFPTASNAMTIEVLRSAQLLYTSTAAEKLLFTVFQKKAEIFKAKVKGTTAAERAKWLARLRDAEGSMAELDSTHGLRIVEYHSPILDLLRAFPIIARLETELFQRILHAPVRREESGVAGSYCCTFHVEGPAEDRL